jgi:hypothetical protein
VHKQCDFVVCCDELAVLQFFWPNHKVHVEWYCARHYDMMVEYFTERAQIEGGGYAWNAVKANL